MNVLVYDGPGTVDVSLKHTLASLKSLLSSRYAVQTISQQSLTSHPWTISCSLLVFPAGRSASLPPAAAVRIQAFVDNGGGFLGFAGAGHRSAVTTASTNTELSFLDRTRGTCIYPIFHSDAAQHSVSVQFFGRETRILHGLAQNGRKPFVDIEGPGIKVLAKYIGSEDSGETAALCCDIGAGKVVLLGSSLEYPITGGDLVASNASSSIMMSPGDAHRYEEERMEALRDALRELGLDVPSRDENISNRVLPQFLTCHPSRPGVVSQIVEALAKSSSSGHHVLQDTNDTFHFHPFEDSVRLLQENRTSSVPQSTKHIIVCREGVLPAPEQTPFFDIAQFYRMLSNVRPTCGLPNTVDCQLGMGEVTLYGELVTSTQTMLDRNPRFLSVLPTPLLSLASQQLSGRGRGSNVWLSPLGGLQFSLLLRVSLSCIPAAKLVFVQYLFSLAVTEACREDDVLGALGSRVRLKWPNDLYAAFDDHESDKRKIGGVLVTTSFTGGNIDLVIGCGLNLLNAPPIPSLSQLLPQGTPPPRMEHTAAMIMAKFEKMWDTFIAYRGSFDPFMDLYLERWLHSDQMVTLTTTVPPVEVRIMGVTEHGLLRTVPERSPWHKGFIDLQPDGNSFDMMAGMIKVKSSW